MELAAMEGKEGDDQIPRPSGPAYLEDQQRALQGTNTTSEPGQNEGDEIIFGDPVALGDPDPENTQERVVVA